MTSENEKERLYVQVDSRALDEQWNVYIQYDTIKAFNLASMSHKIADSPAHGLMRWWVVVPLHSLLCRDKRSPSVFRAVHTDWTCSQLDFALSCK